MTRAGIGICYVPGNDFSAEVQVIHGVHRPQTALEWRSQSVGDGPASKPSSKCSDVMTSESGSVLTACGEEEEGVIKQTEAALSYNLSTGDIRYGSEPHNNVSTLDRRASVHSGAPIANNTTTDTKINSVANKITHKVSTDKNIQNSPSSVRLIEGICHKKGGNYESAGETTEKPRNGIRRRNPFRDLLARSDSMTKNDTKVSGNGHIMQHSKSIHTSMGCDNCRRNSSGIKSSISSDNNSLRYADSDGYVRLGSSLPEMNKSVTLRVKSPSETPSRSPVRDMLRRFSFRHKKKKSAKDSLMSRPREYDSTRCIGPTLY